MSLFIVFEGLDGSGKSTQQQLLNDKLQFDKISNISFREPGSTVIGDQIIKILQSDQKLSPLSELLLFYVSRSAIIEEKIKPALANYDVVICDRYFYSSVAYQGYGRGLNINNLELMNTIATDGLIPDITFILDIDPQKATERLKTVNPDRMEAAGIDFFKKIRQGYCQIREQNQSRCIVINGEKPQKDISKEIHHIIMKRFKKELTCSY